jgi:opacity protein-like surface antigen
MILDDSNEIPGTQPANVVSLRCIARTHRRLRMKQWNAPRIQLNPQFTILSLSLIMSVGLTVEAYAQDADEDYSVMEVATAVPATLRQDDPVEEETVEVSMQSMPVRVAPAMNPVPVPVDVMNTVSRSSSSRGYSDPIQADIDSSKNSNASGIQIFNLNNNKHDQEQMTNAEVSAESRADVLRRERIRKELLNETRLIEKIEEDRITQEGGRSNSIESIQFAEASAVAMARTDLEEVQVSAVASASAGAMTPAPMVSTSSPASLGLFSSTEFKIAPMVGYRWTPDNDSYFRSENQVVAGVAVEGRLANVLGLEVSYVYGRDKLKERYYSPYAGAGYNPYGYGGGYAHIMDGDYGFMHQIRTRDTHEFNANVKLGWFVGQVRPYALGGIGTRYTAYNIDNSQDRAEAAAIGWKRSSVRMTSTAGGGLDYRLTQNLSLGSRVEWQYVFGKKTDYSFGGENIIELYGDTKNNVRAFGSLQLVF